MTTARDKFYYTRTLCCLLKALEGVETEIELRNESHVKGTVESVTAAMNVTMRNCELNVNGRSKQLQRMLVQGRKIRMVIIPDHIDMIDAMQNVISMYSIVAKGRNEFKKIPKAKQRGRGKFRGGPRGRGRGSSSEGGRGGEVTSGRWRGRGAPHQNRGRGSVQTHENISGKSCGFGAGPDDSASARGLGIGMQTFDEHSAALDPALAQAHDLKDQTSDIQFKKNPQFKQRGRGNSWGGLMGRGRGLSGQGQGRGSLTRGRQRGRGALHQNRARSLSVRTFGGRGVGSSSGSEGLLHPDYRKQVSDDFVSPHLQESSQSVLVGETSSKHRTEDIPQTLGQPLPDQMSDIQCSAVSITARSAMVGTDLRRKLQLQHQKEVQRRSSKSSERRHSKSSRSSDRLTQRESESSLGSSRSGDPPEKHYSQVRKDKESRRSRHDKYRSDGSDRRRTSHDSSPSTYSRLSQSHSDSKKSKYVSSERSDSVSQKRSRGDSDRHRPESVDRCDQRQQKYPESSRSGHSRLQHSKDSSSGRSKKPSSSRE